MAESTCDHVVDYERRGGDLPGPVAHPLSVPRHLAPDSPHDTLLPRSSGQILLTGASCFDIAGPLCGPSSDLLGTTFRPSASTHDHARAHALAHASAHLLPGPGAHALDRAALRCARAHDAVGIGPRAERSHRHQPLPPGARQRSHHGDRDGRRRPRHAPGAAAVLPLRQGPDGVHGGRRAGGHVGGDPAHGRAVPGAGPARALPDRAGAAGLVPVGRGAPDTARLRGHQPAGGAAERRHRGSAPLGQGRVLGGSGSCAGRQRSLHAAERQHHQRG